MKPPTACSSADLPLLMFAAAEMAEEGTSAAKREARYCRPSLLISAELRRAAAPFRAGVDLKTSSTRP